MSPGDLTAFCEQFQSLHSSITAYLNEIVALESIRPLRMMLVISTLTRTALIRLHERLVAVDNNSKDACMRAANGILTLMKQVRINEFKYIDPIMAVSQPGPSDFPVIHV